MNGAPSNGGWKAGSHVARMAHLSRDKTAPTMGHPDFWGCAHGLEGWEDGFVGGGFAVFGRAVRGSYSVVFGEVIEESGHDRAGERTRRDGEGVFVEGVVCCGLLMVRLGTAGSGFLILLFLLLLLFFVVVLVEVESGDLEGVEEQAGAAGVDVVEGEVGEDLADGLLDVGAGGGFGQRDGVAAGVAGLGVGGGSARLVVEVAVVFVAQGVAAAAVSVDEDVAAAEVLGDLVALLGNLFVFVHGAPLGISICKFL